MVKRLTGKNRLRSMISQFTEVWNMGRAVIPAHAGIQKTAGSQPTLERREVVSRPAYLFGLIPLILTACAVGPDFKQPPAPQSARYTTAAQPTVTTRADQVSQRFDPAQPIDEQWWTQFGNPDLDALIAAAQRNSPTLDQARARILQAQEQYNAQFGATQLPSIDGNLSAERKRINPQAMGFPDAPQTGPFTLYNASVGVSYTLDIFGGNRRALENLQAATDYQRYELRAAQLTLAGNIVTSAVREASLREQIGLTQQLIASQQKQLQIGEQRQRLGATAELDTASLRGQLAQLQATLPPLQQQLQQTRHLLAVYSGQEPGLAQLPVFTLDKLHLPANLPLNVPSELARRRPDIQAAEAMLHQASAQVGVATANLFPKITLSGSIGSTTNDQLFGAGSSVWNLMAGLTQPIFHGGELRAQRRAAIAAYDASAAAYRQTVLQGLQNVADVLQALSADADALQRLNDAAAQQKKRYDIATGQYRVGGISYLDLLNADSAYRQALLNQSNARANRYADTAALFLALGGGWQDEN